jgi:hypothetical protein
VGVRLLASAGGYAITVSRIGERWDAWVERVNAPESDPGRAAMKSELRRAYRGLFFWSIGGGAVYIALESILGEDPSLFGYVALGVAVAVAIPLGAITVRSLRRRRRRLRRELR